MFKHNVTYKDFNGNERKEDLYFHLSLPELTRIEAEIGKSLQEYIQELTANQDLKTLLAFLERMILSSYGQKTSDGKSFHKSKAIRDEFEYSQAYAEIFEQFITDPELAKKFGEKVADDGKARKNQVNPQVVNNQPQQ
jgi:hypothetical protein